MTIFWQLDPPKFNMEPQKLPYRIGKSSFSGPSFSSFRVTNYELCSKSSVFFSAEILIQYLPHLVFKQTSSLWRSKLWKAAGGAAEAPVPAYGVLIDWDRTRIDHQLNHEK